jgi:sugar (pentulose or hexulose) kinase
MRQALKQVAIGANVARLIRSLSVIEKVGPGLNLVVVGGPAADDELIPILSQVTGIGAIGRGNVAGKLGHRYAVAYGLSQL